MNLTKPSFLAAAFERKGWSFMACLPGLLCWLTLAQPSSAAECPAQHLTVRQAGGMPPVPIITSLTVSNQQAVLNWRGFLGPYQVLRRTNIVAGSFQPLGAPTQSKTVSFPRDLARSFFEISGPSPPFAGISDCAECHFDLATDVSSTAHTSAFGLLKDAGQATNSGCLPCHTLGFGVPTGFQNEATTPRFENVQCENCHGPAAFHAGNPDDLTVRPLIDTSAKLCGGCHTGAFGQTYDEWVTSSHAEVTDVVAEELASADPATVASATNCAACHSGSVRLSLLQGQPIPCGQEAAAIGIVCITCHDPHVATTSDPQLRNPLFSTNFFSYSTRRTFASQYNPNINLCGQCHNARGAAVTDTSRSPHHSPQYNILLASVGVTTNTLSLDNMPPHWRLPDQCAHCHMQMVEVDNPTPVDPHQTGHTFRVDRFDACFECHVDPEFTKDVVQFFIRERINEVKASLDLWATTKAPLALRTNFGALAWEYTSPGDLSNPTGDPNIVGPSTAQQTNNVPTNIFQARFNLYLVFYDGSFGVHNSFYSNYLLDVAAGKVAQELAK